MARPHSHRPHPGRPEKSDLPVKANENPAVVSPIDEPESPRSSYGLYVALVVWMIGFFALMMWVLFDLILGLVPR